MDAFEDKGELDMLFLFQIFLMIHVFLLLSNTREQVFSETNMLGTWFGETGLKKRPDVFRHDNCE